jgi:CheY-like chemotaxis protein
MAGRGLAGLLNDLLDLSRVEAGRMEIAAEPLRPGDVLRQTAEALRQQATDKGLAISAEVEDGAPEWLDGDEQRLRQILFNLAGNAIKFTERGRVALRLRPDGERLLFEVEDTGMGIPRDQIHRLFESFTQIDDSTTRRHQGTGLGLAIVKNLVELMGGEVWVESEPGEGSAFRFTLPLRPIQDGNPGGPAPRSGTAEEASAPAKRVLVVEDNEINRMVARRLLDKLGHECRVAGDGAQALDILAEQPFDLVLMDIQMPGMDGLETVRRLRAGKAGEVNRRTPVAALTAHAGSGDRERAREAGIGGYLPKPLDLNELDSEVRRLTGDE